MKNLILTLTAFTVLTSQSAFAATLGCDVTVGGANFGPESASLYNLDLGQMREAYFNSKTVRVAVTYLRDGGVQVVADVFDKSVNGYVEILNSSSGAFELQNPYLHLNSTLGTNNGAVSVDCALMTPSAN